MKQAGNQFFLKHGHKRCEISRLNQNLCLKYFSIYKWLPLVGQITLMFAFGFVIAKLHDLPYYLFVKMYEQGI